jgi:uracil-DNA glycosylase family 4
MGHKTDELKALCLKLGHKYVGFRGNSNSPFWFVGEAPGADEDQYGLPFVGSSGKELDKMLKEAGIDQSECYFTNPYKVRPPSNDLKRLSETGIPIQLFLEQFFEELFEYKPPFIIPLGGTPLGILCSSTVQRRDNEAKISKWRGSLLASERLNWPCTILPNFHPAYILREWSDRDVSVFIFRRLKEEYDFFVKNGRHQPLPERQLIPEPSYDESREYLEECLNHDGPTSLDIELLARRVPICISASYNRNSAISISFFDGDPVKQAHLWRLLNNILATKPIVGQNWTTFDTNWMGALGFESGIAHCDDTLVRHHVLHPEMSHKLDFQVLQYTREPYYKDEGRGWQFREGMKKLKLYNCKDSACTLEVFEEQELEFNDNPNLRRFYNDYEMPLARAFHSIDKRGISVDPLLLDSLRMDITKEQDERCVAISQYLQGKPVTISTARAHALAKVLDIDVKNVLNIASVPQLKELLKNELKIKLKIDRHTHKETTGEESLNDAFASTGNPVLKDILRIRELNKILGTYVDAKLSSSVFYSCYSVTGTVTGRRASRKNFLGFGSNGQNQPKHSDLGERFQGVFIARPGHVFVYCDQASAEEWPVQGIIADVSGDDSGIRALYESMATGISRHARLAAQLFGLPLEKVNNKECIEYYIGKKTRHAGTYDMRENTMAAQMAAEGFVVETKFCKLFLEKFHEVEPNIRKVYHKYVETTLNRTRTLTTPLGRERVFHSLRPYGDNGKVYREAYAYIPQSTVGDNNGLAILHCQTTRPGLVLMDGHDSCLLEVEDNWESVLAGVKLLDKAYDRTMTFPNGFQIKIPIDYKIGFSIKGLKKCPGCSNEAGLMSIYMTLHQQQSPQNDTIFGVQSQPLAQL